MAKKGQTFKRYSNEIKEEILRKYLNDYISASELSKEYEISKKTIQNWIYKTRNGKDILIDHRKGNSGRLRKEISDIDYKERYEILKNTKPSSRHNERKSSIYQHAHK